MTAAHSTEIDWQRLVQAEYLEMPGLHLTKPQVQRLWGLEPDMCDTVLDALVASEFLKKTVRGVYVLSGTAGAATIKSAGLVLRQLRRNSVGTEGGAKSHTLG